VNPIVRGSGTSIDDTMCENAMLRAKVRGDFDSKRAAFERIVQQWITHV
jgi:hypothetical protein